MSCGKVKYKSELDSEDLDKISGGWCGTVFNPSCAKCGKKMPNGHEAVMLRAGSTNNHFCLKCAAELLNSSDEYNFAPGFEIQGEKLTKSTDPKTGVTTYGWQKK